MSVSRLTPSRRGAWTVNISKHLRTIEPTHPGLDVLNNLAFAGQCGELLITLSGDDTEQLKYNRVQRHARVCGIDKYNLKVFLSSLRTHGCLDWDIPEENYEVLAFSRQRVLETTSAILEGSIPREMYDEALIELLEFCLLRPRFSNEVEEFLSSKLDEEDTNYLLDLVASFHLLGVVDTPEEGQKLYFNTHKLGDRAKNIGQGLMMLSAERYEEVNKAIDFVDQRPGTFSEDLPVSSKIKEFIVGMGLLDVSVVLTGEGPVEFLTSPRLSPPSVGAATESLEYDVFHHAKMLLTSFRYGELKSSPQRGRIIEPGALVSSLLHSGRVGPCTAIGEDYVNLEAHGVLRTIAAKEAFGNQFYMELRRREPAQIALDLLNSGASDTIDAQSLSNNLKLPTGYIGPEVQQKAAYRKTIDHDSKSIEMIMKDIRTL